MKDENQNVILQSNVNNSITYTGRRYDQESDLYYYRNRMYSPTLGIFMSNDPKGYVDGMNLYAYVKNNPLKYLDAFGTTSIDTSQIQNNNSPFQNKTVADNLRLGAQTLNVVGTSMLATPITAPAGVITLAIGLGANVMAEIMYPASATKTFRNSAIDVITSSIPGGFAKDTIIEVSKTVLDFLAGD